MSAGDDLRKLGKLLDQRHREILAGVVDIAHESIQLGHPITGAPGQPVGQYHPGYGATIHGHPHVGGFLRASWIKWFESPYVGVIATNAPYARMIEEGVGKYGPITIRSTVGGSHSVKMTIAAFQRIVDYVAERTPLRTR